MPGPERLRIAVVGAGGVGTSLALHLAQLHEVTVVARAKRLEQLMSSQGVITANAKSVKPFASARVTVAETLDVHSNWDAVLVTVLAHQVDAALLQALKDSNAQTVVFVFNTLRPLKEYRDAVGDARCAFGFPGVAAYIEADGSLVHQFFSMGQRTLVTSEALRRVFNEASIPTDVEIDMQGWLRTHAVAILSMNCVMIPAALRDTGASWAEAMLAARIFNEGIQVLHVLGERVHPAILAALAHMPLRALAFVMWSMTQSSTLRKDFKNIAQERELKALLQGLIDIAPLPEKVPLMVEYVSQM